MPLFPDRNYGSGIAKRARLDVNPFGGDLNSPLTKREMNDFLRKVKEWSDQLMLGRIGFQVEVLPGTVSIIPTGPAFTLEWEKVVEDSHNFTKDDSPTEPLTIFEIPPGLGRVYTISWQFTFSVLVEVIESFAYTGASDSFTIAGTEIYANAVEFDMKGAAGNDSDGGAGVGGKGQQVTGTLVGNIGDVIDVYVGGKGAGVAAAGWPNGGAGDAAGNTGGGGGGSTSCRISGDPFTDSFIVAGGGGGASQTSAPVGFVGGNAGNPAGGGGLGDGVSQAGGGTQSAGGVAGVGNLGAGTAGASNQGGAAGNTTSAFAGGGGGGGGGFYGGGGGGSTASPGTTGGSGGGGSSYKNPALTSGVTFVAPAVTTNGSATFTYYTTNPPTGSLRATVYVAYRDYPNMAPYEQVIAISQDEGISPLGGSLQTPLGEGDRIWLEIENDLVEPDVTFVTGFLSVYAAHSS